MDVAGKVAFITGAGSGIGRATAQRLARESARVAVIDIDQSGGEETVAIISGAGGRALFIKVDVCDAEQMRAALERTVRELGGLHIVYNNAGIGTGPPGYPGAALDQWRRVLDIDLQAVLLGCYLAAPLLERGGGGAIVNTASMAGLYPFPNDPVYGAAKAGVVALTYALAPWAAERKIRVNCVCPGVVDTPLVRRGQSAREAAGLPSVVPASMLKPEQIADAVMDLLQDDTLFGRALEVRPGGKRLVETPRRPGQRR